MFVRSKVPFIGLGFLVIGCAGFVGMAFALDDFPALFAIVICWYVFILFWAVRALGGDRRRPHRFPFI